MKYGRIENGILIEAPAVLRVGDREVYQPSRATFAENGYKPVEKTPYPEQTEAETGKIYVARYTEEPDKIVQIWVEAELTIENSESDGNEGEV